MTAAEIIVAVITKVKDELQKQSDPLTQPLSSNTTATIVNVLLYGFRDKVGNRSPGGCVSDNRQEPLPLSPIGARGQ